MQLVTRHRTQVRALTSVHQLPVVEHTLREGLAGGVLSEFTVEAKGLHDREESLDSEHGCSWPLLFAEDLSTTLVQARVDTTNGVFGTLDFDLKYVRFAVSTTTNESVP